jgi:hypothetical protein
MLMGKAGFSAVRLAGPLGAEAVCGWRRRFATLNIRLQGQFLAQARNFIEKTQSTLLDFYTEQEICPDIETKRFC